MQKVHLPLNKKWNAAAKISSHIVSGGTKFVDSAVNGFTPSMRSKLRELEQHVRSAQDGISLLRSADGVLGDVSAIYLRMRDLAVQSQSGTYTDRDREAIQDEIDQLYEEIEESIDRFSYNGMRVLADPTQGTIQVVDDITIRLDTGGFLPRDSSPTARNASIALSGANTANIGSVSVTASDRTVSGSYQIKIHNVAAGVTVSTTGSVTAGGGVASGSGDLLTALTYSSGGAATTGAVTIKDGKALTIADGSPNALSGSGVNFVYTQNTTDSLSVTASGDTVTIALATATSGQNSAAAIQSAIRALGTVNGNDVSDWVVTANAAYAASPPVGGTASASPTGTVSVGSGFLSGMATNDFTKTLTYQTSGASTSGTIVVKDDKALTITDGSPGALVGTGVEFVFTTNSSDQLSVSAVGKTVTIALATTTASLNAASAIENAIRALGTVNGNDVSDWTVTANASYLSSPPFGGGANASTTGVVSVGAGFLSGTPSADVSTTLTYTAPVAATTGPISVQGAKRITITDGSGGTLAGTGVNFEFVTNTTDNLSVTASGNLVTIALADFTRSKNAASEIQAQLRALGMVNGIDVSDWIVTGNNSYNSSPPKNSTATGTFAMAGGADGFWTDDLGTVRSAPYTVSGVTIDPTKLSGANGGATVTVTGTAAFTTSAYAMSSGATAAWRDSDGFVYSGVTSLYGLTLDIGQLTGMGNGDTVTIVGEAAVAPTGAAMSGGADAGWVDELGALRTGTYTRNGVVIDPSQLSGMSDGDTVTIQSESGSTVIQLFDAAGTTALDDAISIDPTQAVQVTLGTPETGRIAVSIPPNQAAIGVADIAITADPLPAPAREIKPIDVSTADKAVEAVVEIDLAAEEVTKLRSHIGAIQNRLAHYIDNMDVARINLTEIRDRIENADVAREMMEYVKNNIGAQVGMYLMDICKIESGRVIDLLQGTPASSAKPSG